jgi:hypothetical protein
MLTIRKRTLLLSALILSASLALLPRASAQCGFTIKEFQNISLEAANPFQAAYTTNITSTILGPTATTSHSGLKSVARDSAGRVRVARSAGKYMVKTADGVESEIERQSIWICDPTTATFTILDTANKSATVNAPHANIQRLIRPGTEQGEPFCTSLFARWEHRPHTQIQNLGHQLISGYDAVGIRIQMEPLTESMGSSYTDLWCSDDLGAVLQQANASESRTGKGFKNESTMQSVERQEPDPSLFQIPPDYTVLQRLAHPATRS